MVGEESCTDEQEARLRRALEIWNLSTARKELDAKGKNTLEGLKKLQEWEYYLLRAKSEDGGTQHQPSKKVKAEAEAQERERWMK